MPPTVATFFWASSCYSPGAVFRAEVDARPRPAAGGAPGCMASRNAGVIARRGSDRKLRFVFCRGEVRR